MITKLLQSAAMMFFLSATLRADQIEPTLVEQQFDQIQLELPDPAEGQPFLPPPPTDVILPGEPCGYPFGATEWKFQIDLIPTTSKLSDGNFGVWTEDPRLATRITFSHEDACGLGMRGQSWAFAEKIRGGFGTIEAEASAHYFDIYQRVPVSDGELLFGGGLAIAHMKLRRSRYIGGGASVVGEGFYPLLHFEKAQLGLTGRARFALVTSWDDDVFHDHTIMIDDFGWGVELRRRFGPHGNYWFIDIVREFQHWTSTSDFFSADESFQGVAFNFGAAW